MNTRYNQNKVVFDLPTKIMTFEKKEKTTASLTTNLFEHSLPTNRYLN